MLVGLILVYFVFPLVLQLLFAIVFFMDIINLLCMYTTALGASVCLFVCPLFVCLSISHSFFLSCMVCSLLNRFLPPFAPLQPAVVLDYRLSAVALSFFLSFYLFTFSSRLFERINFYLYGSLYISSSNYSYAVTLNL